MSRGDRWYTFLSLRCCSPGPCLITRWRNNSSHRHAQDKRGIVVTAELDIARQSLLGLGQRDWASLPGWWGWDWRWEQCFSGVEVLWSGSQIFALFCCINSSRFKTGPSMSPARWAGSLMVALPLPQAGRLSVHHFSRAPQG